MTNPDVIASPRPLDETSKVATPSMTRSERNEKEEADRALALEADRWSDLPCTD